jgi:glycerol kinase
MRYVLALDQGTTSSRAMIVDSTGAVRSMAQKEFRQIFPRPGWVEHDPEEELPDRRGQGSDRARAAGAFRNRRDRHRQSARDDDRDAQWQVDRRFEPQAAREAARARRERWSAAVERAKRWETGA